MQTDNLVIVGRVAGVENLVIVVLKAIKGIQVTKVQVVIVDLMV